MEEWAVYGIGEPDENGVYPDYRRPPAPEPTGETSDTVPVTWTDVLAGWDIVVGDLAAVYGVTPAVVDVWHDWKRLVWGLLARPDQSVFAERHRDRHAV